MFESYVNALGCLNIPKSFNNDQCYMHKFRLEDPIIPIDLTKKWLPIVKKMIEKNPIKFGEAYLTIDERFIKKGKTHRRGNPHVDGNYIFDWGGGGGFRGRWPLARRQQL